MEKNLEQFVKPLQVYLLNHTDFLLKHHMWLYSNFHLIIFLHVWMTLQNLLFTIQAFWFLKNLFSFWMLVPLSFCSLQASGWMRTDSPPDSLPPLMWALVFLTAGTNWIMFRCWSFSSHNFGSNNLSCTSYSPFCFKILYQSNPRCRAPSPQARSL